MKDIKLAAAALLVAAVVLFVLQNTEPVRVAFLVWSWSASRAFVVLLVFLVGVAVGWLARAALHRRRR
jgi:uncharacterized integral membrane protein